MTFHYFETQLAAAGLKARDCGNGHWQAIGGVKPINFYPDRPTIYVNGAKSGIRGSKANIETVIRLATDGTVDPCPQQIKRAPGELSNNQKKKLRFAIWKESRSCRWCNKPLTAKEATLDHIVPKAQGGSDRVDNFCVACEACNKSRGSRAVDPTKEAAPFGPQEGVFKRVIRRAYVWLGKAIGVTE